MNCALPSVSQRLRVCFSSLNRMPAIRTVAGILLALFICSACSDGLPTSGDVSFVRQVRNGQAIGKTEFSGVGIVITKREKGVGICTGTLIQERVVLTAAHCVWGDNRKVEPEQVFFSLHPNVREPGLTVVKTLRVETYPGFALKIYYPGDIAVLLLESALTGVNIYPMANSHMPLKGGDKLYVVGYGMDREDDSGVKRVGILSFDQFLGMNNTPVFISTKPFSSVNQIVCPGDSGGPAFLVNGKQAYVLGVAHANNGAGGCQMATVAAHTYVPLYYKWVTGVMDQMVSR